MNAITRCHAAWGVNYRTLAPLAGFLEGNKAEHAEAVLHELCHGALLNITPPWGDCGRCNLQHDVTVALEDLSRRDQDLNEIRTVAAELQVLSRFGLAYLAAPVVAMGLKNSELFRDITRFESAVEKASKTARVRHAALRVHNFVVNKTWEI